MNALLIILGFLIVWVVEAIPIIKDKDMKKVIYYSALMLISLSLSLTILFCNKEVSIAAVIEKIMKSFTKYVKV
jgi:hypothetical protein